MQFAPASGVTLTAGQLVKLADASTVDLATCGDDEDFPVFMVLEGNDTYSGNRTGKVVVLAGIFVTTVTDYQTGSYVVNDKLTASAGKFVEQSATKKVLAHVLDFSLSQGLKVLYGNK
ncbi:MAG: hypothetical protein ACTSPI_00150 [Candidatus Heimdallarchaeaceae archaeon]